MKVKTDLNKNKVNKRMNKERMYKERNWICDATTRSGILDCFASLAMTNSALAMTLTIPPSLRGTKQSRTMKHEKAYNDKGCKSLRSGILDCFASLAMTNEREGRRLGDVNIVETRGIASHHSIDDAYSAYNVYDWETRSIASLRNTRRYIYLQKSHGFDRTDIVETRSIASLRNTRRYIYLQKSHGFDRTDIVETRCFASHHASHHAINDAYNAYNVYDWETRSIASLHSVRQNINLQKKRKEQNQMKNKDKHLAMSRRGLNMYNPLQAERSWGYRKTNTFSELRSSSIYRRSDNADFIGFSQIRKKICGHLLNLRHLRALCLFACCLLITI
jgi:hypothetical protein